MPISGLEEIMSNLENLQGKVMAGAEAGMSLGLETTVSAAKEKAPFDTGQLRQMISKRVYAGFGGVFGNVRASAEHAPYIEFGTGAVGQASGGKAKAYRQTGWVYKGKKGFVFTRGQPARPFLYPAFKETEGKIKAHIAAGIKEAIGK